MEKYILSHESAVRLSVFLGVFFIMAAWEGLHATRPQTLTRRSRWPHNILLVVVNTLLMRLIFPVFPLGVAIWADTHGWGLLNLIQLPDSLAIILALLVLDLAIYTQHVLFHFVPVLWRLHRVHHADTEIDVTTGSRFHPIEIALSMAIKMVLVAILGVPPVAIVLFEVILNGAAMFNHANVSLPATADRVLRWVVVTPDMHRVHHSELVDETNSNYGFNVPWWDRLFATYRDQPRQGHGGMTIGLPIFRSRTEVRLDRLLTQPFRSDGTSS